MATTDRAHETVRKNLLLVRGFSVMSALVGALCLIVAVLALAGVRALPSGSDTASEWNFFSAVVALVQAAFYIALAVLGFRCSRDRFKVKPFCILSVILAVLVGVEQVLDNFPAFKGVFNQGLYGIFYLLFCVLSIINAFVCLSLMGYNRSHPEHEER